MRRGPLRVLAVALVVAVVGGIALRWRGGDPDPAEVGYRISYAVQDLVAGSMSTEIVAVQPPLRSRRLMGTTGSATTEQGVYQRVDERWRQVAVVLPAEVGSDLRLTQALAWAAPRSLAVEDGAGTIAGQSCTWWLTREPLDLAPMAAATTQDAARSCVDARGRLLADTWRAGGRDLRRRTATLVETTQRIAVFDGQTPVPVPAGLRVSAVERRDKPAADLVRLRPPTGLALLMAARSVDVEPGTATAIRRTERAVYASAGNLLVADQVRGASEAPGVPVDLGRWGQGRVSATGGGLVLAVPLGPDRLLRVRSSLSYDAIIGWLATLERLDQSSGS